MAESGKFMAGLTLKSLKRHKSLVPLLGAIGLGALAAGSYVVRLATTNPDVSWDKKKNPEPWQKLGTTGQYKFFAARHDYKTLEKPADRPDI